MVTTDRGELRSRSVVVATGDLSFPSLGATSFGHDMARSFGLTVIPPRPALVPFVLASRDQNVFGTLAGVSLPAAVRCGGRTVRGSLLFTHRGLSGPAALQASSYWKQGTALAIDLLPRTDIAALFARERAGS